MTYNEIKKASILKWRKNHREEYNEYMLTINTRNYYTHQDHFKKKRMDRYYFDKECIRLRNILIDI